MRRATFLSCALCVLVLSGCLATRVKQPDADLTNSEANAQLLDGAFVYLGEREATRFKEDKVDAMLDEFAALRMKTLIFSGVRILSGACGAGDFGWGPGLPDKLGLILDGAAQRGLEVYLGVTTTEVCNPLERLQYTGKIAADVRLVAGEIHSRWGTHPAFKGWYIPHEPGVPQPTQYPYYKAMSAAIRAHSELPIVVAPYLAFTTKVLTPGVVAGLARGFLEATKDAKGRPMIQAWQDSVGATGVDLHWRRGDPGIVEEYYKAISQSIGKENLWADIEVFNCCVPPFGNGAYAGASTVRLNQQLWAARAEFATKRVSWLPQIHMGEVDEQHFRDAKRLKAGYLALQGITGSYVRPAGYQWLTPPSGDYPDGGQELVDMATADPKRLKNPGWIGVNGTARFSVDLGATTRLNFMAVHVLNEPKSSVRIPDKISLKCLDEERKVTQEHVEERGFEPAPALFEYVLSNYEPLDWSCRHLEVELPNGGWTFMSELEMTSP